MKLTSTIWPLAALIAGGLILRRRQAGVGATRQLQIDFGDSMYEPTVDLWQERRPSYFDDRYAAEREEARRSAGKAYDDMVRYYNRYGATWGRKSPYRDVVVDSQTGDEYNPTDVYEIYGRPVISSEEPHLMETIQGSDLQDLSLIVDAYRKKAGRLGWELWLYQNGEEAEYLG